MKRYLKIVAITALILPLAVVMTACGCSNSNGPGVEECKTPAQHVEFLATDGINPNYPYPAPWLDKVTIDSVCDNIISVSVPSDIVTLGVNFGSMFYAHHIDPVAEGFKVEVRPYGSDNWIHLPKFTPTASNPVPSTPQVIYVYNDMTNWRHSAAYVMVGAPNQGSYRTVEFRITSATDGEVHNIILNIHRDNGYNYNGYYYNGYNG